MAERIVNLIAKKMIRHFDVKFDAIKTENIVLTGGNFKNYKAVEIYTKEIYNDLKEHNFTKKEATYLVHNYGKQTDIILERFNKIDEKNTTLRLLKAEIWFTIQYEMTCTPTDFFMRRTGRLFFDKPSVNTYKEAILNEFTKYFNWDISSEEKHRKELESKINISISFN